MIAAMQMRAPDPRPEPLAAFNLCRSTDPDEVRHSVGRRFCDHRLNRKTARGGFDARFNHVRGRDVGLAYLRYGSDVEIDPGHLETFYLLQIPLRGSSEVTHGGDRAVTGPGSGSMLTPTRPTRMQMSGDCEKILVQIERAALHETVERHLGLTLSHPIVFRCQVAFDTPRLRAWQRKLGACIGAASAGVLFADRGNGAQRLIEEELVAELVQAQPGNVRHFFDHPQPAMLPGQLRRAQAYMHDAMAEPITIAQVAEEAGVSARCLQLAFQKRFGCSPLQYLRRIRMEMAHFELQNARPGQKVSDIAFGLGFFHLGRFSIAYRERFGLLPSETLSAAAGTLEPL